MKTADKDFRPTGGEWRLLLIGLGLLAASALPVFLGFGGEGGDLAGVVMSFLLGFLGLGLLGAVLILRWFEREGENPWSGV
jgi:hypothetical protein